MLKEIALKTKVRNNLFQSKTRSLETRVKCLFISNAVEETSIKWFRILSLSLVAVTLLFVCSFFCRSVLEKLSYHLWITWMMARALNSRFPLTRRRYGILNPGADPGFLKGGWLIPIGHQTIRLFGLNCPRVHLRAHAPHRRNMSERVLPPL